MRKYIIFITGMMASACMMLIFGLRLPTMIALIVLLCGVSMDFLTTYLCLRQRGREGNPVIAFLFKKIGIGGSFGLLVCMWAAFIMLRWLPSSVGIQTAIACVYWVVPMNNLWVLRRLKRVNKMNRVNKSRAMQTS